MSNQNQFITGNYNQDGSISVWFRNEKGIKDKIKIVGFIPYFYVRDNVRVPDDEHFKEVLRPYTGIYGNTLQRLNMSDPRAVGELRSLFEEHWEADIRFAEKRWLIDTQIKSGFIFPEGQKVVHFKDLKPVDFSLDPVVTFWDIEVRTKTRFPNWRRPDQEVISSSVWDTQNKTYLTFMLDKRKKQRKKVKDWMKVYSDTEENVVGLTIDYFKEVMPDVTASWSLFDPNYFIPRSRRIKINCNLRFTCFFDLCGGYKFLHKRPFNRLKDMVIEEGIAKEVVSEEFHLEYWERPETRDKFMLYNKKDVEYMVLLDTGFTDVRTGEYKKYDIIKFYWDLKNFVGQGNMQNMSHGLLIDTLLLRKAFGRYVLPSMPPKTEAGESFRAAAVFEPPEGVFGASTPYTGDFDPNELGVAVLDMSRFYPNIVKAYYPKRLRFSPDGKENLFPEIIDDLMAKREQYEAIMARSDPTSEEYKNAKRKRDVVKSPLLSGVWGYIAWGRSRVADLKKAEFIAGKAREGLDLASKEAEKFGVRVLYGDTDSIMPLVALKNVPKLVEKLNVVFTDFCKKEGISPLLKIKMDRFYRKALWVAIESKKTKRGAQKRYMGHCVVDGGKKVNFIDTKGFERVRGDASKITKRLQGDVGDAILRKGTKGLIGRIQQLIKGMEEGKFSYDEMAITKTLHLPLDKVSKKTGKMINVDYYRGSRYGNKYCGFDIRPGDTIKMLYVHRVKGFPRTDVICYLDADKLPEIVVNTKKMINRTVEKKVSRLLKIAGLSWQQVLGFPPLKEFW